MLCKVLSCPPRPYPKLSERNVTETPPYLSVVAPAYNDLIALMDRMKASGLDRVAIAARGGARPPE